MKKIFRTLIQYYLKILTRIVIWRHKPMVIAVAGTTNKTFVKEVILSELGRGPNVRGNPKSFNTEIGLPLAVLFLPSGYSSVFKWVDVLLTGTCVSIFSRNFPKVLVLEMGVDRKGDMKYLLSLVKPTIAVVTNIDRSFPDTNTTLDDIALELSHLVESIPSSGGLTVLNGDDVRVANLKDKSKSKVVLCGVGEGCDAKIGNLRSVSSGERFSLEYQGETDQLEIEKHGMHNIKAEVIAKVIVKHLEAKTKIKKK